MDTKKFIDRNQMQIWLNRISRLSRGNSKKRDIISLMIFAQVLVMVITVIQFYIKLLLPVFIENILPLIDSAVYTIDSLVDYSLGFEKYPVVYYPTNAFSLNINYVSFYSLFVLRAILVLVFLFFMWSFFKRETLRNEIIKTSLVILAYMFLFDEYRYSIVALITLLILSLTLIGTNKPYFFVNNIFFFMNSILDDKGSNEKNKENNMKFLILWAIVLLVISKILSILFGLSIDLSLLLALILITRFQLYIQSNKSQREIIIRMLIYIGAFLIVLQTNELKNGLISWATEALAIFFALDRLFSLYKELVQSVQNSSVEYYTMEISKLEYSEKYISDDILSSIIDALSDKEVLIQCVIRSKLGLVDSFYYLESELRKYKKWEKYKLFLMSLKFYMKKSQDDSISIIDFLNEYKEIILFDTQLKLPINFIVDYGVELMKLGYYEAACYYLCYSEYYISLEYIENYYYCVKQIGNSEEVERLELKYAMN